MFVITLTSLIFAFLTGYCVGLCRLVHLTDNIKLFENSYVNSNLQSAFPEFSKSIHQGYDVRQRRSTKDKPHRKTACKICPRRNPWKAVKDHKKHSIFSPLTMDEMINVDNYLRNQGIITSSENFPKLHENYVLSMHLLQPIKLNALAYLDNSGSRPARYAKVVVHRGAIEQPDVMEYQVGPLGKNAITAAKELLSPGKVPYSIRPMDDVEWYALQGTIKIATEILEKLYIESFDGATLENNGLFVFITSPQTVDGVSRQPRFHLVFNVPGAQSTISLHPLPFAGTISAMTKNESDWRVHSYYYLNQGPFQTAQDLLKAYKENTIRKMIMPNGYRATLYNNALPSRKISRKRRHTQTPPPRTYEPGGPRYRIRNNSVRWMSWTFDVSSDHLRGPSVHNVKFKGERIAYEIALNEIALSYASNMAGQTNMILTDSMFGIGSYGDLIKGIDCPEHATLLETTIWKGTNRKSRTSNGICVFEVDDQGALWRHSDYSFASGLKNNFLVVRTTTVIGNYDYIIDFRFYLDGKVQTTVKASGYIQASFWDSKSVLSKKDKTKDPFGYRVSDYSTGSIHDHTFGFKVDLDIVNHKNSFQVINWKAGKVLEALRTQSLHYRVTPPQFIYNDTRYLTWETIEKETRLKLNVDSQKFWTVINNEKRNKWRVPRGYRIIPMATGTQVLPDTYPGVLGSSFTKSTCTVTKYHDDESHISSTYDVNSYANPIGGVDKMLNQEMIMNEDIVAWLAVGFLHIPISEDYPMTVGSESGFWIQPFNFFDETQSLDVPGYLDHTGDDAGIRRPPSFEPCLEPIGAD